MRRVVGALGLMVLLAACGLSGPKVISGTVYFPAASTSEAAYVPGEVLVAFDRSVAPSSVSTLEVGGTVLVQLAPLALEGAYRYRVPDGQDPRQVAALLRARPGVRWAQPNYVLEAFKTPNDPYYGYQWHYPLINLPEAWDLEDGTSRTVKVAVLDTGVVPHPDLNANLLWGEGYDFVSDPRVSGDGDGRDPDPTDTGGNSGYHGTHVAGTIAAVTDNGEGVAGVSWGAKIVPVRVLGPDGGSIADIVDALVWVADRGVEVVNMSLGGAVPCAENPAMQEAIDRALSKGVVVVVAAGNDDADAGGYTPAGCSGVITVGAVDLHRRRAYYSNYGAAIEVMAPGGDVRVDDNGDGYVDGVLSTLYDEESGDYTYVFYQGTSMAAPHVAGVVALMKAKNPDLTPAQVAGILMDTADPISCDVPDGCGAGLIDARAALEEAERAGAGDFSLVLDPASLVLAPGQRGSLRVTVVPSDGFSGSVDLSVSGVPAGVGVTISPSVVEPWETATLTLEASSSVSTGSYVVTVRGSSGSLVRTAQFPLLVDTLSYDVLGTWVIACYYVGEPDYCDEARSWAGQITTSGTRADYVTDELAEGNYLVVAWLDANASEDVDEGDYLAVYPRLVRPPVGRVDLPLYPYSSFSASDLERAREVVRWGTQP